MAQDETVEKEGPAMNNTRMSTTSSSKSIAGKTRRGIWKAIGGVMQRLCEWLRKLLRLARIKPDPVSRSPGEPNLASDGPPSEDRPAQASYSVWRRRLREYPGDLYPNSSTRRTMRSGAGMWIDHAFANGLDPAHADWVAIEKGSPRVTWKRAPRTPTGATSGGGSYGVALRGRANRWRPF